MLVEDESLEVEGFTVLEVGIQQPFDILQSGIILFQLHTADGSPKQQRKIILLVIEGISVHLAGLFVSLNEAQAIALSNIRNMLLWIDANGSVEILQCQLILLEFEEQFATVNIGLVILGVFIDALIQLNGE